LHHGYQEQLSINPEANTKERAAYCSIKMKLIQDIQQAYDAGQRSFGENKVQELREKQPHLPKDINWHMIGHLQTNKVKYIAPYIYMIHAVDSLKLLKEINKRALANERTIKVLLQVHIAKEDSKFGLSDTELWELMQSPELKTFKNIQVSGLMGMATNTQDMELVRSEFKHLRLLFDQLKDSEYTSEAFSELSMGMSNDYQVAIEEGSTMIRLGTSIFGLRACAID
jgi:pyridoxal phosphate enzyme (YggS family)